MSKAKNTIVIADEIILNRIYMIRGLKVMIDRDLADLYRIETKVLKQAVRRNIARFPKDFMFIMNANEFKNWRSQFVTSNMNEKRGLRYAPYCFTEQGVTMLSCILNSKRAIDMNIRIIRIFTKLREMLMTHKDLLLKLEQLERKMMKNDVDIAVIFAALKKLISPPSVPMKRIGFRRKDETD